MTLFTMDLTVRMLSLFIVICTAKLMSVAPRGTVVITENFVGLTWSDGRTLR